MAGAFQSVDEALKIKPDAACICTFSNDHVRSAVRCAKTGCHLFIEKPLSLDLKGTDELAGIIKEKNLITMVGCNMRFHPAMSHIHKVLTGHPLFAKKLWGNFEFGFYLPFDKEDYQSSYKANKCMGGNLIFDDIHELDIAVWWFGQPQEVVCYKKVLSSLKMDTEDNVDMIIKFKSGAVCNVHMDYLQHQYSRRCKVVCEEGTISWDFSNGRIATITKADRQLTWMDMPWDLRDGRMYKDEIRYFLNCVKEGKETFNSVERSMGVLKLAVAANKSCVSGTWERVEGE